MQKKFTEEFNKLQNAPVTNKILRQSRGRDFEALINDVFKDENILLRRGYHTHDNRAEQIDGAVEIDGKVLLIETKWVESNLAASDLFAFIGKIENKFVGTLGVFISREKLSENFVNALSKGRRQSVIIIHGEDIDNLFDTQNDLTIKDYIKQSIKICSYDNISHLPFSEYKKTVENSNVDSLVKKNTDAIKFVERHLKNNISENDLLILIESNTQKDNNDIFKLIIEKYYKFFEVARNNFDYAIIQNFDNFLKIASIDEKTIENVCVKYYNELIFKNFSIYSQEIFINLFSKYYNKLSKDQKQNFENALLKEFKEAINLSNWNKENQITDIIRPIWMNFLSKDEFKQEYLSIYLRDTLDKFSQKQFANYLVNNNQIGNEFAEKWLIDRISEIKKEHKSDLQERDKRFVALSYVGLNQILKKENWIDYITELFDN